MKIILLLLSLAFLPLSTLATCTSDAPNQLLRVVHDIDGRPLKSARYFIHSASWGAGGEGVLLANIGHQEHDTCPHRWCNPPMTSSKVSGSTSSLKIPKISWFQIKSLDGSMYKLAFCPDGVQYTCENIGIIEQNRYRRLALTENAKAFVFIKDNGIEKADA
ncbi:hypothetical protein HAX54_008235 [Datura stramonium]|uniref:Uncharacterized protein n=1 Tax=Datura stramonium TaxID=4076 RepID=A0ABS8TCX8_DATST|nr:hypothetical protein [Datura stramonium]